MKVKLSNDRFGNYTLTAEDGRDRYFQLDYDFPGLASHIGWEPCMVAWAVCKDCDPAQKFVAEEDHGDCPCVSDCPNCGRENLEFLHCPHDHTDGSIDCTDCGMTTLAFIESAAAWLDAHDGETFEDDAGYFDEE